MYGGLGPGGGAGGSRGGGRGFALEGVQGVRVYALDA